MACIETDFVKIEKVNQKKKLTNNYKFKKNYLSEKNSMYVLFKSNL